MLQLSSRTRQLPVNVIVNVQPQYNGHFCWQRELASPAAEFKWNWEDLGSRFRDRELSFLHLVYVMNPTFLWTMAEKLNPSLSKKSKEIIVSSDLKRTSHNLLFLLSTRTYQHSWYFHIWKTQFIKETFDAFDRN